MSLAQIDATALLCRLLERDKPEINGQALVDRDQARAGLDLLRERLLVVGSARSWVTCPECGVHTARVVRELAHAQMLLSCDECGEVNAPRRLQETYKVHLTKVVDRLLTGLGLNHTAKKEIMTDQAWRMGTTEPARGKAMTWYFARNLHDPKVAYRVREQIRLDQASQSSKILTSTELPLPDGSPLEGFDVVNLASVGRISQSTIEFFPERLALVASVSMDETPLGTTLRTTRQGRVYVDGKSYELEPRQQKILIALIEDRDHEMTRDALRTACGSQAKDFSPSKVFNRNQDVYQAFICYQQSDDVYALIIPAGDHGHLN